MKKLLFLIDGIKLGGAEKNFINQANALQDRGFEVYFGVLREEREALNYLARLEVEKDRYFNFGFKNLYDLGIYRKILKTVSDNGIDVLYSTLPASNFIARVLKIFKPKLRVVIREANVAGRKNIKLKIADIILSFFTDKIIAVSEMVKDDLSGYLWFRKDKIAVIQNSISLPSQINDSKIDEIKQKYHLEGKYIILNIGKTTTEQKGQIFALYSLKRLVKDFLQKDIKLLLIGGQPQEGWLNFVRENNLEDLVLFLDRLLPEEINTIYAASDLFILPSLWEGFPNVVLEAAAFKLPIIATDVGGVREIISDNHSGLIIKPKDADSLTKSILKIKNEPKLAEFFAENAFKTVKEKFLFENNLSKLIKILNP